MNEKDTEQTPRVQRWIVGDRAVVRDGSGLSERAVSIGIAGPRIVSVRSAHELRGEGGAAARARGEDVIDVGARPIVPAFVNGHSHLAMAPFRGITTVARRAGNVVSDVFFALERHLLPEDVRVFTRLGALESLLHGVGEVWDHYYFGTEVAEGLREAGLCGVVAPTLQDLSGPGKDQADEALQATEVIATRGTYQQAGIAAALGPHASDTVSDELFSRISETAVRLDLPVHLHLAQSIEEVEQGRGRFSSGLVTGVLEALGGARILAAHGLYFSEEDCARLTAKGAVLAYCPNSQMQFGFLGPVAAWRRAGGTLALGTDCVASNDALDVQRELPLLGGEAALAASFSSARRALVEAGGDPSAVEVRRRSLIEESNIAEPEGLLGVGWGASLDGVREAPSGIIEGAWANLLVLDPNHPSLFPGDDLLRTLAYGSTAGAIEWGVFAGQVRGRALGLSREILGSDVYRETLQESRRRRDELLGRAKMTGVPSTS